jgi:hypothetical protein
MKVGITKDVHGLLDLTYIPLVWFAPKLAHFETEKVPAEICKAFALTTLGYAMATDAKWGLFKIIPYRVHAILDFSSGILAIGTAVLPFVCRNKSARNTFILMGLTGLIVGALSFYSSSSSSSSQL